MNRDVCEHFTPAGIPCIKCQTSPRLEKAMATESELLRGSDTLPKLLIDSHRRTVERSIDAVLHPIGMHVGNLAHIPVDILQRMLNGIDELERELASLRQKQVLWEAGNRELADRLEARDVAIDALRAEKERAEAERDEAIRMRDRHAEASKAQNEDITALMAERDAALKDAALWRKHSDVVKATYVPGALHVRVTMSAEASRTEKCWQVEYVISTDEMESGVLKNHIIGMKTEQKVAELFAAIDAARKGQQ